jgi:hypothetical protein
MRNCGYMFGKRPDPKTQNPKKISYTFSLKINSNILTFYIKSITFITIQIKKLLHNKFFHFFIQNITTFFSQINQI